MAYPNKATAEDRATLQELMDRKLRGVIKPLRSSVTVDDILNGDVNPEYPFNEQVEPLKLPPLLLILTLCRRDDVPIECDARWHSLPPRQDRQLCQP
jgi:hypothetical protein